MKKTFAAIITMAAVLTASTVFAAEYSFDGTLDESGGGTAAEAVGTVSFADGVIGSAAVFSDSSYLTISDTGLSEAEDFTVAAWVNPASISGWARVFDFGNNQTTYMFLTPDNGSGVTTFAITTSGSSNEQKLTAASEFQAGVWTHVAVTKSGETAVLYIDGVEAARNESMTLSPKSLGATTNNYIAKSQYDDPYFSGSIDELYILPEALSADEIYALAGEANADIQSVSSVDLEVRAGDALTLPSYVTATFADGSTRDVRVSWEEVASEQLTKDGAFTVTGTISGTDVTAEAAVTVSSDSITDGVTANTEIYADGGVIYADYTVYDSTAIENASAYVAVYSGGALAGVGITPISTLTAGTYTASVTLPDGDDTYAKTYLWSDDMEPITSSVTKQFGNAYGSSFEVSEVTLNEGIFKDSQELGKSFIMSLDPDRLLAPVAYATGASTDTSNFYGGWEAYSYRSYKGTGIAGHSLGHWLSAMSSMYAATGDAEVKEKLDYTVAKLAEYQEIDGSGYIGGFEKSGFEAALSGTLSVSSFDLNGYWVPWYSMHKIYQGLIDAYKLGGNDTALDVVCKFADWAISVTEDMSDEKFAEMLNCEYGGMNEAMAELYEITGEKKYLDLAVRFTHEAIITPLSQGLDELEGKHANTQIPKVLGAAAIYNADSDYESYRAAAEYFYDIVVNNRSYVIGGNSNREHFESVTAETLGVETLETCNTYNMMKLAEYLYQWDHNAEYMDYYELALFNHILASQDPESGEKTYFMSTEPGHFKVYSDALDGNSFWCCVGSGMENPGRYTRDIYYHDGDAFYVNQFISSTVDWSAKGLTITQTTNYPYEDTTVITVDSGTAYADFNIRIPAWIASAATIQVNDEAAVSVSDTGYYTISRTWSAGDTITVTLPMGLRTYTARDSENKVAFMYGPVALAGCFGTDTFPTTDRVNDHTSLDSFEGIEIDDLVVDDKDPNTFITLTNPETLEFTLNAGGDDITLLPYADVHHQRYTLYWYLYGTDEEITKDEFSAALEAATIDSVQPNEQQPEVDHNLQSNSSNADYFSTVSRGWRDARGADGYFSYDMDISSDADTLYVMALYWGSDGPFTADGVSYTREFTVSANDTVLATVTLNNNDAGNLIYEYYEIPEELRDEDTITVKFAPTGANKAAGGVFEVRITTEEVQPE